MRLRTLSYITLWVVKFEEVKRLYRDVLGLPVAEDKPGFIMFQTEGSRLAFHKLPKAPPLTRLSVELHFEVRDVDETFEALKKKGVKFEEKPANMPWGTRMASFLDPEGYRVELVGPLKPGEPIKGD